MLKVPYPFLCDKIFLINLSIMQFELKYQCSFQGIFHDLREK